jgi:sterol desaturase/sphingolipid hydroxylase (fatty acid hydroxylase superfamily)
MQAVPLVLGVATGMMALERLFPGVEQPRVKGWWIRVFALNACQVGTVYFAAWSWDRWLPQLRLFDGSLLPTSVGIVLGYLTITFAFYWWHRARHASDWLWRLHQVHHSPVRIEAAMSFYKHPIEIAMNSFMCSTLLYVLLGLPAATVSIVVAITGVAELLYHSNLRTPWMLGFFFQRPEMHRRHHERGWHRSNYSDIPLWDLLFGTFDNPLESPVQCGLDEGAEQQLLRMLSGREPMQIQASSASWKETCLPLGSHCEPISTKPARWWKRREGSLSGTE